MKSYTPKKLSWHVVYNDLAKALVNFQKHHPVDPGKELYSLCVTNPDFVSNHRWIKNLKKVSALDPIHVFASVSNARANPSRRTELIKIYFKILRADKLKSYFVEEVNYSGCPTPAIINIVAARKKEHIQEIWDSFSEVMKRREKGLSDGIFAKVKSWYGIEIRSFTIFLFWIQSSYFLPLDKNTVSLLELYKKEPSSPKNYAEYKLLLVTKATNLYRSIATIAYDEKKITLLPAEDQHELEKYLDTKFRVEEAEILAQRGDCKVIALTVLEQCKSKFSKVLPKGEPLYFYREFEIVSDKEVKCIVDRTTSMYNINDLQISISAVVGKNGSGKSTITELLIAIINNLAYHYLPEELSSEFKFEKGIHAILYVKTIFLYRITIQNEEILIEKFEQEKERLFTDPIVDNGFALKNLFYNLCVNYSQYSLNTKHLGWWIHALFHKNDAYQTPIVLEPFRKDGNIDINVQEKLLAGRLLTNILEKEDEASENSFRQITETLKAENLKFSIDKSKTSYLYRVSDTETIPFEDLVDPEKALEVVFEKFKVQKVSTTLNDRNIIRQHAKKYVLRKLVSISRTYLHYRDYFSEKKCQFDNLGDYLDRLLINKSHITFKLRQAINLLKYNHVTIGKQYAVNTLSKKIEGYKVKYSEENLTTTELTPPSFFKYELKLSNRISFKSLSSGEKQKIFSVNSILYHLKNIDSVSTEDSLIKYDCVNIILDEIELYFHPEFQRTYLEYLLQSLKKIRFSSILGLNICFVTHSPFILSDIPHWNILFLKSKDEVQLDTDVKTFGANIHELLTNGFFMNNTLGSFAMKQIAEIRNFHLAVKQSKTKENLTELRERYLGKKEAFHFVVQNIGEEYLKEILTNHILKIEEELKEPLFIDAEISKLENQIARLKSIRYVEDKLSG